MRNLPFHHRNFTQQFNVIISKVKFDNYKLYKTKISLRTQTFHRFCIWIYASWDLGDRFDFSLLCTKGYYELNLNLCSFTAKNLALI